MEKNIHASVRGDLRWKKIRRGNEDETLFSNSEFPGRLFSMVVPCTFNSTLDFLVTYHSI
jgi:hypothetical protein